MAGRKSFPAGGFVLGGGTRFAVEVLRQKTRHSDSGATEVLVDRNFLPLCHVMFTVARRLLVGVRVNVYGAGPKKSGWATSNTVGDQMTSKESQDLLSPKETRTEHFRTWHSLWCCLGAVVGFGSSFPTNVKR